MNSRSIYQYDLRAGLALLLGNLPFGNMDDTEHPIARGLRLGANDCQLLSRKSIQQRRFAGVGKTNDRREARPEGHVRSASSVGNSPQTRVPAQLCDQLLAELPGANRLLLQPRQSSEYGRQARSPNPRP